MFLHVSVCPQGGGGVPGQVHPPGRYTSGQVHPPGQVPPRAGTPSPLGQVHPPTPGQVPPPPPGAVHVGRYGQQAGGTHHTGMHSCF